MEIIPAEVKEKIGHIDERAILDDDPGRARRQRHPARFTAIVRGWLTIFSLLQHPKLEPCREFVSEPVSLDYGGLQPDTRPDCGHLKLTLCLSNRAQECHFAQPTRLVKEHPRV